MLIGTLTIGTLTGILSAFVAVLVLGGPVWVGLLAWSAIGSVTALAPLVIIAFETPGKSQSDGLAAA